MSDKRNRKKNIFCSKYYSIEVPAKASYTSVPYWYPKQEVSGWGHGQKFLQQPLLSGY